MGRQQILVQFSFFSSACPASRIIGFYLLIVNNPYSSNPDIIIANTTSNAFSQIDSTYPSTFSTLYRRFPRIYPSLTQELSGYSPLPFTNRLCRFRYRGASISDNSTAKGDQQVFDKRKSADALQVQARPPATSDNGSHGKCRDSVTATRAQNSSPSATLWKLSRQLGSNTKVFQDFHAKDHLSNSLSRSIRHPARIPPHGKDGCETKSDKFCFTIVITKKKKTRS